MLNKDLKYYLRGFIKIKEAGFFNYLKLVTKKLMIHFYPFYPGYDIPYGFIIPFFLWGIWVRKKENDIILYYLLASVVLAVLFYGSPRWRNSVSFCFVIYGAFGIMDLHRKYGKKMLSLSGIWAGLNIFLFVFSDVLRSLIKTLKGL